MGRTGLVNILSRSHATRYRQDLSGLTVIMLASTVWTSPWLARADREYKILLRIPFQELNDTALRTHSTNQFGRVIRLSHGRPLIAGSPYEAGRRAVSSPYRSVSADSIEDSL